MAPDERAERQWFAVRSVLEVKRDGDTRLYEERVTLWSASSFDAAMELAEAELGHYADEADMRAVGVIEAYALFDTPGHGAEVFSLMRESELEPDDYVTRFFSTGSERITRD